MKQLLTITRKELKGAFYSPAAWLFILLFLLINLFSFFFIENFFVRGIADLRPFFRQMPLLLIFLAAAFTMRLWAEESQRGTLELLQTLPVSPAKLVTGKFLAGLALLGVAIICTLPLPFWVGSLGDLDWGPVWGGYLALFFLGGTYLALGLLLSATTSSQLVALLLTVTAGLGLLLIGKIPDYCTLPGWLDAICLALGTGSRFNSMLRGLLDGRDLLYYISLTAIFLSLNILVIIKKRWDRHSPAKSQHNDKRLTCYLLVANIIILNVCCQPGRQARFDLTEWRDYSVSPTTRELLAGAEEPLLIRGYFSKKTHPLLEPLLPQISDFLNELAQTGPRNLSVEFMDPADNPAWEEEAQSRYGIRTLPFRFASRHTDSVINAYFHLLIRYGDNYEVLDFNKLVQVETQGTAIQVGLNNLEYQLAKAIKKSVYSIDNLEAVCQKMNEAVTLTMFASESNLPEALQNIPPMARKVTTELTERCGSQLTFSAADPDDPESGVSPKALFDTYGLRPLSLSTYDTKNFFLHLLVAGDNWQEMLTLTDYNAPHLLEKELTSILKRHTNGFLKRVAILGPKDRGAYAQQFTGDPSYKVLEQKLAESYEVVYMEPPELKIPGDIDIVIWPRPTAVNPDQAFAIDQFLLRGGTLLVGGGSYHFKPIMGQGLKVEKEMSPLAPLLAHYGVASAASVVLDEQNSAFPVPVVRQVGDLQLNEMQLAQYPPFVLVKDEGLNRNNPAIGALGMAIMPWSSPVGCQEQGAGHHSCEVLLTSSAKSWELEEFDPNPDFTAYPDLGFNKSQQAGPAPLAVALNGNFTTYYTPEKRQELQLDRAPLTPLEKSVLPGKLVVFGSSAFIEDIVLAITQQTTEGYLANLQLVKNLLDWSQEDAALLAIGGHQRYARLLPVMSSQAKMLFELWQFAMAFILVGGLGLLCHLKRRRQKVLLPQITEAHHE